jgi:hypothetical protein
MTESNRTICRKGKRQKLPPKTQEERRIASCFSHHCHLSNLRTGQGAVPFPRVKLSLASSPQQLTISISETALPFSYKAQRAISDMLESRNASLWLDEPVERGSRVDWLVWLMCGTPCTLVRLLVAEQPAAASPSAIVGPVSLVSCGTYLCIAISLVSAEILQPGSSNRSAVSTTLCWSQSPFATRQDAFPLAETSDSKGARKSHEQENQCDMWPSAT